MKIEVNPQNSKIRNLLHGSIRFTHMPLVGFSIWLSKVESDVQIGVEIFIDETTLLVTPKTDWSEDGLIKVPTVSFMFDDRFHMFISELSDYLVCCEFFGVEVDSLITNHFENFRCEEW